MAKNGSKYEQLKEYVLDYLRHIDDINDKKIEIAQSELDHVMMELKLGGILRNNVNILSEGDVIPEN